MANVPIAEEDDIDRAVAAAEKAQPGWANLPARKRGAVIRKFAVLILENDQKLSEVCLYQNSIVSILN